MTAALPPDRATRLATTRPRRLARLGGGLVSAAVLAAAALPARGQNAVAPTLSRPGGGLNAPASSATAPGTGTGLQIPPGLLGNGAPAGTGPELGSGGAPERRGLRSKRPRRTQAPTVSPFRATIRPTLTAPGVAPDVQPVLTGIPDRPDLAVPAPRRRAAAEDPWAPLGIRVGNIVLFPLVGQAIGYDTNPNRTRLARGSVLWQSEGELRVQSDWSRDELTGFLRGAWNEYPGNPEASRPEGTGRIGYRHDFNRDTQVDAEAHYVVDTQRPDSPDLNAAVRNRPIFATYGGSVGGTQRFNRLIVGLRGTIDRTDYDDARLASGLLLDQGDRNVTQYGARLRVGYELHPGFVPFTEILGDTRVYDRRLDGAGFARSSDGVGGTIGTTFELTRLLTGEIAVGAQHRSYEDKRLGGLTSPIANASLLYAFSALTRIRATAAAGIDETTVVNATGVRTVRGTVEVAHDLRRNLTVTAGLTAAEFDYQGAPIHERSFGALLRADWRLNRNLTLRASYAYETLSSSIAGSSYASNVWLLGMRLQP